MNIETDEVYRARILIAVEAAGDSPKATDVYTLGGSALDALGEHYRLKRIGRMPVGDVEPILQFFAFAHLPPELATISAPFSAMAENMIVQLQRTVALRKLLEAKDAAVRAKLYR